MALKFLVLFLGIIVFLNCKSQNLVLNPGFEEYYFFQNSFQDFMKKGLMLQIENRKNKTTVKETRSFTLVEQDTFYCKNWFTPTSGHPDYFNKSNLNPIFSVPANIYGYHNPHSGNAYIGLGLIEVSGGMEHITGKLSESLQREKNYKVTLFIKYPIKHSYCYVRSIGVKLTVDYPFKPYLVYPFYDDLITKNDIPDIDFDITHVSTDTNWVKLSGVYHAKGGEKYITIGLFYQVVLDKNIREATKKMAYLRSLPSYRIDRYLKHHKQFFILNKKYEKTLIDSCEQGDLGAYYFIDDVCVEEVKE